MAAPYIVQFRRMQQMAAPRSVGLVIGGLSLLPALPFVVFFLWRTGWRTETMVLMLIVFIVSLVITAWAAAYGVRMQRTHLNKTLGLTLTAPERRQLSDWYWYAKLPRSRRLRPVLPVYVDYLQSIADGSNVPMNPTQRRLQRFAPYLYGSQILLNAYIVLSGDATLTSVICLLLFSCLFVLSFLLRPGASRARGWYAALNRRALERIACMRRQLAAPAA